MKSFFLALHTLPPSLTRTGARAPARVPVPNFKVTEGDKHRGSYNDG